MSTRAYNFCAGPAYLPDEVVREAQSDIWDYQASGLGVMEISHRGAAFQAIIDETLQSIRRLMNVPDTHEVILVPAGATLQFSMIAMNLCGPDQVAQYLIGGYWAEKAYIEGARIVQANICGSSRDNNYRTLPEIDSLTKSAAYVHFTSNNTIMGTQHRTEPNPGEAPLICDASSDILSRPIDVSRYGLIYACAQKNLGIAGITIVIIDRNLLARSPKKLPILLNYNTYVENGSLYNTIPTFPVYVVNRVMRWLERQGGTEAIEKRNQIKAQTVYDAIDAYPNFYRGHAAKDARSLMNIAFFTPTAELDAEFIKGAEERNLKGLKGHKILGGMRVSLYNACPQAAADTLAQWISEFAISHES